MKDEKKPAVYAALFIVNFLSCLGFGIVDPFFPIYVTHAGATGLHLALMFSGYSAAKMFVSPASGWASDKWGRHGLLIAGFSVYAVASALFLILSNLTALIVLKLALGFAAGIVRPVLFAQIGELAPDRREGTAMGTFDISFYAALAIGPVIGGTLRDTYGFPAIFLCLTLLCILSLATVLFFCKRSNQQVRSRTEYEKKAFRMTRTVVALSAFIFSKSFGITLLMIFLPIFMMQKLKLKGIEMGIVMASATVMTTMFLRPVGRLTDKIDRFRMVAIGGIVAALLVCCLPFARGFSHLLLLVAATGFFSTISLPASSALLVKEGGELGMGATVGIFNAAMNLGTLIAPLVGGLCVNYLGIHAVFYAASAVSAAGVVCFWFVTASPGDYRKANNYPLISRDRSDLLNLSWENDVESAGQLRLTRNMKDFILSNEPKSHINGGQS